MIAIVYTPNKNSEVEKRTRKWLGTKLANAGIAKYFVVWYNVHVSGEVCPTEDKIIVLGAVAGVDGGYVLHLDDPTWHRRFYPNKPYPLIAALKELSKTDKEQQDGQTTHMVPPGTDD